LNSYQHFRKVEHKEKKEQIEKDDAVFYADLFDSLEKDQPNGKWSIQADSFNRVVRIA
jgi:hypothetical protein